MIVLPAHWDRSYCDNSRHFQVNAFTSSASTETADFHIVGDEHPIFGSAPFTQQSQGCGKPGDFISVGYQFLTQYNESESTSRYFVNRATNNNNRFHESHRNLNTDKNEDELSSSSNRLKQSPSAGTYE